MEKRFPIDEMRISGKSIFSSFPISHEGIPFIGGGLAATLLLWYLIHPAAAVPFLVLTLYFTYFFRSPRRSVPCDPALILSPGDGTVMDIQDLPGDEESFIEGPCRKIIIFMSIFDVHVNRSPVTGTILYEKYSCGRFRPAYKDDVGFVNEQHLLGIEAGDFRITVKQIAGILARRIVSYVSLGDSLRQGTLYGMIKFGSCLEVVLPESMEIRVQKGDKVKGGTSILAVLPHSPGQ